MNPLVWEEGQGSDDRFAPTPPVLVRLQELTQPRQVDKDGQDEAVERQEGEHSKPERELDEKEHYKRHCYQQRKG